MKSHPQPKHAPAFAGDLDVSTVSLPDDGSQALSYEEENLNTVLEKLPNFFINKPTSKIIVYLTRACFGLLLLPVTLAIPIAVGAFFPLALLTGWGLMATTLPALALIFVFIKSWAYAEDRFRLSSNTRGEVNARQVTLRQAISLTKSPALRGRLSELFFLCENPKIDQRFWQELREELDVFIVSKQVENVTSKDIEDMHASYRLNPCSTATFGGK